MVEALSPSLLESAVYSAESRSNWPLFETNIPEDSETYLPLIPRVFDLPYKSTDSINELRGQQYERECIEFLSLNMPENYNIFGPNFIAKALGRSFFMHHPTPDAFIFKPHKDGIALTEMSEFKLGRTESSRKVHGFSRLIGKIRTNKDDFRNRFQNVVNNEFYIPPIYLPNNDEIEFTFATPWTIDENRKYTIHDTPCNVFFFRVPTDLKKAS